MHENCTAVGAVQKILEILDIAFYCLSMENSEKYFRYLSLFGLDADYTADELSRVYRTLAKITHPDINRDTSSEMRMVLINEGYDFLRKNIGAFTEPAGPVKIESDYAVYRQAYDIMKKAFDEYFGYEKSTNKNRKDILVEKLADSKKGFAGLINEYPASKWAADSIDRIFLINLWME